MAPLLSASAQCCNFASNLESSLWLTLTSSDHHQTVTRIMDSDVNCSILTYNETREYISYSWYCEGIVQVGNFYLMPLKVGLSPDIMPGHNQHVHF